MPVSVRNAGRWCRMVNVLQEHGYTNCMHAAQMAQILACAQQDGYDHLGEFIPGSISLASC